MKKILTITIVCFLAVNAYSQELFLYTEPASNMGTNNLGIRFATSAMNTTNNTGTNIHLTPELMYGITNKIMLHVAAFQSNRNGGLVGEGGSIYAKYKFLNKDDVQRHFRMATFGRYSLNNADIHQEEINLFGHNTGYELGVVATQLLHKVAISTSVSYFGASNNGSKNKYPSIQSNAGSNYTLSFGKLMLPKKYKDYKQVNLNIMCEFLGQALTQNGKSYLDVAPSIQLIFNSKIRVDLGYKQELYSTMLRTAPSGFLFRFEYNFFNTF